MLIASVYLVYVNVIVLHIFFMWWKSEGYSSAVVRCFLSFSPIVKLLKWNIKRMVFFRLV